MDPETTPSVSTDPSTPTPRSHSGISPGRRRAGAVAAVIVAVVLPLVVWQTWGWWESDEEAMFESAVADRRGGAPGGPGGGTPDPQAMRRQFHERIRATLEVSDPEWASLQPKVERVTRLQEELRPRGGMTGPPGAPPTGQSPADASEYVEKTEMLRAAVDDEQVTEQALAANLSATRAARAKLRAELKAAQEDLRKGLTPKQEASLALLGVLD